jgi:hypothetical protein
MADPHDKSNESSDPRDGQLERLRGWRNWRQPDLSMKFIKAQFKRDIEKPYKQLGDLATIWERHVPAPLLPHTRLESLARGTLRIVVDSSAHLYELDNLLRNGLERTLVIEHKGPAFRKVQLRVGNI